MEEYAHLSDNRRLYEVQMNIAAGNILLACFVGVITAASAPTNDTLTPLLNKRYSGYEYDASRPVSKEIVKSILEAGRLAPSSYNEQPWVFIICDRAKDPEAYQKALNGLVEFNQGWAKKAPILVLCIASTKSAHNNKVNRWAQYDTGAAAFSMMLEATSLGLMAHQMGGFDEEKLRKSFSIPDDYVPMGVMALGYQGKEDAKPKKRKDLKENFFEGAWGKGFE